MASVDGASVTADVVMSIRNDYVLQHPKLWWPLPCIFVVKMTNIYLIKVKPTEKNKFVIIKRYMSSIRPSWVSGTRALASGARFVVGLLGWFG